MKKGGILLVVLVLAVLLVSAPALASHTKKVISKSTAPQISISKGKLESDETILQKRKALSNIQEILNERKKIKLTIEQKPLSKGPQPLSSHCVDLTGLNEYVVTANTVICPGYYEMNDTDIDGAIIFNTNNVQLDCDEAIINGSGSGFGIYANGSSGIQVLNCNIRNYREGIYFDTVTNALISNSNLSNHIREGVLLLDSNTNTVSNNNISNNAYHSVLDITGNGNKILSNLMTYDTLWAMYTAVSSANANISGNNITNSDSGVWLGESTNSVVENNLIQANTLEGIIIEDDGGHAIKGNTILNSGQNGIQIFSNSNSNTIQNNTVRNSGWFGVRIFSGANTVKDNNISQNSLAGINASSSGNLIYNNYFSNSLNAYSALSNKWNTTQTSGANIIGGPYLGGNFWSDYTGVDNNVDGLGDTLIPYNSGGKIQTGGDFLPLVVPGGGGGQQNTVPTIFLVSPANETTTSDNTPDNVFYFTDPENLTASCTLYYNGTSKASNSAVPNNTQTTLTASLTANGIYSWYVTCNDGVGSGTSLPYTITINAPPDTTPPVITIVPPTDSNLSVLRNWFYVNITLNEQGSSANMEVNGTNYSMSQGTTNLEWFVNRTGLLEGNYTWRVFANDLAGNTGLTGYSWVNITVPPVPPQINTIPTIFLLAPANNTLTTDATPVHQFYFTDPENSTIPTCSLYYNGTFKGGWSNVANNTWFLLEASQTQNGIYSWNVVCNDGVGSNTSETRRILINAVTIPNTAPTIFITAPLNNTVTNNRTLQVDFYFTDNEQFAGTSRFYTNGTLRATNTTTWNNTPTSLIYGNLSDGIYNFWINVSDGGLQNRSEIYTIAIDGTTPVLTFVSPTPSNQTIAQNWAYVKVSSSENLISATLEWNGVNESMSGSGTNWFKNKTSLVDGNYTFRVYGNDFLPNTGKTEGRWVVIDITPPSPVTNLGETATGTTWIYWQWTNPSNTDFNHVEVWLNGTFIANTSGTSYNVTGLTPNTGYQIQVRPVDNVGNKGVWTNDTAFTLVAPDVTPPLITIIPPTDVNISVNRNWTYFNITLNESGSGANVEVNGTNFTMLQGLTNQEWFFNLTQLDTGNYTYRFFANDLPGNTAFTGYSWVNISWSSTDTNPPGSVTNLRDTQNDTTWILWNWTNPTDLDFNHVEIWINGTFNANVSTDYINVTGLLPDTGYEIQTRTVDNSGNINPTWVTDMGWTKALPGPDLTPPTVTFESPTPNNTTVNQNWAYINVSLNETGSSANLEWNGVNYSMSGSGMNWFRNMTTLANGNYTFKVYASDLAGNIGVSEERWVEIFVPPQLNTVPTINILFPPNNTLTTDDTPSIWFSITDPENATTQATIFFNGTNMSYNPSVINNTATKFTVGPLALGLWTFYIYAFDGVGSGTSLVYNIIIAPSGGGIGAFDGPTIFLVSPPDNAVTSDNTPEHVFYYLDKQQPTLACALNYNLLQLADNSTTQNNTNTLLTPPSPVALGTYEWNILCNNGTAWILSNSSTIAITTPSIPGGGGGGGGGGGALGTFISVPNATLELPTLELRPPATPSEQTIGISGPVAVDVRGLGFAGPTGLAILAGNPSLFAALIGLALLLALLFLYYRSKKKGEKKEETEVPKPAEPSLPTLPPAPTTAETALPKTESTEKVIATAVIILFALTLLPFASAQTVNLSEGQQLGSINITPATFTKTILLNVTNKGSVPEAFYISLFSGPNWAAVQPARVSLNINETKNITLTLKPPLGILGEYTVRVKAESVNNPELFATYDLRVIGPTPLEQGLSGMFLLAGTRAGASIMGALILFALMFAYWHELPEERKKESRNKMRKLIGRKPLPEPVVEVEKRPAPPDIEKIISEVFKGVEIKAPSVISIVKRAETKIEQKIPVRLIPFEKRPGKLLWEV